MEITDSQYQQIEHCLPRQRGNVRLSNLHVLNAILYVAEQGCKWRALPKRFGNWHTIYTPLGPVAAPTHLIMDRAYQGDETRQLALNLGYIPVVPPKKSRLNPWEYDREMYKKRNEVERLFRRLKGFRRIFSRFDKLDVVFLAFIHFALIVEALR